MDDRHDKLIRRAAALKAESAALKLVSEELVGRVAGRSPAGTQGMEQPGRGPAAGTRDACPASPGPERAPFPPAPGASRGPEGPGGEVPATRTGAGILDENEAMALAGLLEELAARDPLNGLVLRAAALLRQRVAAERQRSIRLRWGGPAARREAGDTRDDDAGSRDTQAAQRDLLAVDRDERARGRDLLADTADEQARVGDQRIRDLLWDAELRGQAGQDRARDGEDRDAIREMLAQARVARQVAWRDRCAAGQDRIAACRDRGSAQADRRAADRDRQTARADRDQAVIEGEEEDPR
jgi:hypothetical protein